MFVVLLCSRGSRQFIIQFSGVVQSYGLLVIYLYRRSLGGLYGFFVLGVVTLDFFGCQAVEVQEGRRILRFGDVELFVCVCGSFEFRIVLVFFCMKRLGVVSFYGERRFMWVIDFYGYGQEFQFGSLFVERFLVGEFIFRVFVFCKGG